ncbi:hotdog fold domain-containing protein [Kribbella solani]|uniref:Acyl-coenzyme A thioesterase PaaI-like protein n=1 Tax=Kribbella solani TaxID=236067 RepID=A0A841DGD9_9ACTN|nr:hotdog fold domain-containing protein [Kribbella solani]MBB5977593.1 acyl-coenzyme A thioesterase PaaI-like protein [Kribbella solani]
MGSQVLGLWERLRGVPGGEWVFSWGFAWKAPYFRSVRPRFVQVGANYAALTVRKRRAVLNHLGTVHAIAVCNGLEAAMGALAEATVPPGKRWLPKGMEVAYLAKSTSDLTCTAETDPDAWEAGPDVPVRVRATRADGTVVVEGTIHLWVTAKKT